MGRNICQTPKEKIKQGIGSKPGKQTNSQIKGL